MGLFAVWLQKRMKSYGFERGVDLAKRVGVSQSFIYRLIEREDAEGMNRSDLYNVAQVLRVSLERFTALAAGQIEWIEDSEVFCVPGDRWIDRGDGAEQRPREIPAKENRGVPDLGWLFEDKGLVQVDDAWDDVFGLRLSFYLRTYDRAYAFRVGLRDDPAWKVCRNLPAYEAQAGQHVVAYICDEGGAGEGVYGSIYHIGPDKIGLSVGGERKEFKSEHVVRMGVPMYEHPKGDPERGPTEEAAKAFDPWANG